MDNHQYPAGTKQDNLDYFSSIVREKIETYRNSPLTIFHDYLLKIFFDLAQQHDGLDSFYQICVAIPEALTPEINASLAVLNNSKEHFQLASSSLSNTDKLQQIIDNLPLQATESSYPIEDTLLLPVISRPLPGDNSGKCNDSSKGITPPCLGILFITHFEFLNDIDRLFLEKLVTRIGYNLQRRLLQVDHLDHVNFLKRLGRDIGHNVITPNMHFKNLFRQLQRKINLIDQEVMAAQGIADEQANRILTRCNAIRADLSSTHEALLRHYNRTSLYLETLLREEHFSKGRFILRARRCQIEDDIIIPELEVYKNRFQQQGISIDRPQDMRGRRFFLNGDLGLLSQVFDNLFSNAVKYTSETRDSHGMARKAIAYGCRDIKNFPVKGKNGVKFNIFSTGEHLTEEERLTIFNDGVRGGNVNANPGSGHGLAFVRNVVEIHGGEVGYEAVPGGNNFYFILPLPEEPETA